jgi:hypothetical protein
MIESKWKFSLRNGKNKKTLVVGKLVVSGNQLNS